MEGLVTLVLETTHPCRLYTVVLVDVEDSLLLWMVINIPGSATRDGQVVWEICKMEVDGLEYRR